MVPVWTDASVEYLQFVFKIHAKTSGGEVNEEPIVVGQTRYHLSQHTSLVDVYIPQDQVLEEYVGLYFEDLSTSASFLMTQKRQ